MDLLAQNAAKAQLDKKNESRRKLRQIQVREQTNEWMEVNRKKYQAERDKCVQLIMSELIEDLQKQEVRKIEKIEKIYDLSAEEVGTAHRAAENLPDYIRLQNQKVQNFHKIAKTRGKQALSQEKAAAFRNQELDRQAKAQREKLRREEDERLKMTAAKAALQMAKTCNRGDKTEKEGEKRRPEYQPGLAKVLRIPKGKPPAKKDPRLKVHDVVYYDTSRPLGIMKYPQPVGLVERHGKGRQNAFDEAQRIVAEQQEAELTRQAIQRKFSEDARKRGRRALKVAKLEHELQRIKNELAEGGLQVDTVMNESLLGLSNSESEGTDTAKKSDKSATAAVQSPPKVATPKITSPPRVTKKGILRNSGLESPAETKSILRKSPNPNQEKKRASKPKTPRSPDKLPVTGIVVEPPCPTSHGTPDQTDGKICRKPDNSRDLENASGAVATPETQVRDNVDGKQKLASTEPPSKHGVPSTVARPKLLSKKTKTTAQDHPTKQRVGSASLNYGRVDTPSFGTLSLSSEDSFPKTSTPAEPNQRSRDHDEVDKRSLFSKASAVYSPRTDLKRKQTLNHFIQKLLHTAAENANSDRSGGSSSQVEIPSSAMNSLNGSSRSLSNSDRAFDRSMSLHEAFGNLSDVGQDQDEPSSSSNYTDMHLTLSSVAEEEIKAEIVKSQAVYGTTSGPFHVAGSHAQSGSSTSTTSSGSTLAEIIVTYTRKAENGKS